jgi:hypothetical protein
MAAKKGDEYVPVFNYKSMENGKLFQGKLDSHVRMFKVDGNGGKTELDHQPKKGEGGVHGGVHVHNKGKSLVFYH